MVVTSRGAFALTQCKCVVTQSSILLLQEEKFLKRYLEYARSKCSPRLSEAAADLLIHEYVDLREEVGDSPFASQLFPRGFALSRERC